MDFHIDKAEIDKLYREKLRKKEAEFIKLKQDAKITEKNIREQINHEFKLKIERKSGELTSHINELDILNKNLVEMKLKRKEMKRAVKKHGFDINAVKSINDELKYLQQKRTAIQREVKSLQKILKLLNKQNSKSLKGALKSHHIRTKKEKEKIIHVYLIGFDDPF